jgi:hypothetical protein
MCERRRAKVALRDRVQAIFSVVEESVFAVLISPYVSSVCGEIFAASERLKPLLSRGNHY